jgi:uncharacterized damage-inducible protein DinB
MSPENAQVIARAMISLWQGEFPATVRVLTAVPDSGRDYTPHAKSRTGWQLATHLATADLWFLDSIRKGAFVWDQAAAEKAEASFGNSKDVVAFYEKAIPAALDLLGQMSGEDLAQSVDFFGMMQMPRAQWIGFANNHSIHHRGQLSSYLRAMGAKVPDIYGPSADAEPQSA